MDGNASKRVTPGHTFHRCIKNKKKRMILLLSSTSLLICHRTGRKMPLNKATLSASRRYINMWVMDRSAERRQRTQTRGTCFKRVGRAAQWITVYVHPLCVYYQIVDSMNHSLRKKMASVYWFQLLRRRGFPTFICFITVNWTFLCVRVKPNETKWDALGSGNFQQALFWHFVHTLLID